jgi:ornithine cyclodeaminase/alanine dehydrogenase-like protein (mu-crystallin family)
VINYIGVSDIQRLIDAIGTGTFISRLAGQIEVDFKRWGEFQKSARLASHSAGGVIELMPISDGTSYSFKYVNGDPQNTAAGLLTVTAFGVLAEVSTGYPLLLSELTVTTTLRTAAMSALAAKWLARADSRVMALIGNGDIQQLPADFPVVEFADVVRRQRPGRTHALQVTIFDSVGFALEDFSALRFLHALLDEHPHGCRQIDLVPDLENPQDLFGGVLGGAGRVRMRAMPDTHPRQNVCR